jgi:hypothetical protein
MKGSLYMLLEHFYMTGLGKFAYLAIYLPLVLGLLWVLLWKLRSVWPLWIVLTLVLLTLPFCDVYLIGRDADRLCREQGGLHVYKTVEAEGFLGSGDESWIKYGFEYVETGGIGTKKFRISTREGKVITEEVDEYISSYRLAGQDHEVVNKHISKSSHQVISRTSGEILGELVYFSIYPGYFDGIFLKLTGSGPALWHCGNEPPPGSDVLRLGSSDVVRATLIPTQGKGGEK